MLVVGVDEAGYGPLLGPLVVAGAAFRVPETAITDADAGAARVRAALLRAGGRGISFGDSKKLYSGSGLGSLERPVLACLDLACLAPACSDPGGGDDARCSTVDDLLRAVGIDPAERRASEWYRQEPPRFPFVAAPEARQRDAAALSEELDKQRVRFGGLAAEVLLEERLNEAFDETGNKAQVLFDVSARVFERLVALAEPDEPVFVVFDRQGGRKNYLPPLQQRFSEGFVWRLEERRELSTYRFSAVGRSAEARFAVGGDASYPAVSLASMLAKYLRETFMTLWNGWFADLCPDVRPTAGYTVDGRRWLDQSRDARERAGIPDSALVRVR